MDKSLVKAICIITAFSMTAALIIGSIATLRSTAILAAEIDEKIVATTEKYANDFSAEFNHMEGLTNSLASYVRTTFDVEAFENDREGYIDAYKEELAQLIKNDLSSIKSTHSLYVTFNPELTNRDEEVWYSAMDGEIKAIAADFKKNKRDFTLPYDKEMEYFFKPQGKDHGVWVSSYYDKDIDKEVFSYSDAIYVDGLFVGVAGADINAEYMLKVIKEMSLYKGGASALIDENYEFIVHNDDDSAAEEEQIIRLLKAEYEKNDGSDAGYIIYNFMGTGKIMGYCKMQNGWIFITTQPADVVYKPIGSLRSTMIILGVVLLFVFIAFLIAFSKPMIKKTSALEEENRRKEIIIIYQSRQAKIGEMVGNITHQWKQPLNTINLILGNLLDSYRYGDLDEKRLEKSVNKVENIVEKMSETITDFSGFLKPAKEKVYFDVRDCIKSAIALMEESINVNRIKLEISCDTEKKAYGYDNETTHVIFNLLNNARDAVVESGVADRRISIDVSEEDEMIRVDVTNNGRQIPEEAFEHIYEPYFTTRDDTGGTGLGLYISKQIIEDRMGGKLQVQNIDGGVRSTVLIPETGQEDGKEDKNEC